MSHPRDLIEAIQRELEKDYPAGEYTYVIEKSIPGVALVKNAIGIELNYLTQGGFLNRRDKMRFESELQSTVRMSIGGNDAQVTAQGGAGDAT